MRLHEDDRPPIDRAHDGLDRIIAALRGLRYGTVTAIVQDGVVVQVERMERFRLERGSRGDAAGPPNGRDARSTR